MRLSATAQFLQPLPPSRSCDAKMTETLRPCGLHLISTLKRFRNFRYECLHWDEHLCNGNIVPAVQLSSATLQAIRIIKTWWA